MLHVRGVIHVVKEMEPDVKFQEAAEAVKTANLDLDITKSILKAGLKKGEGNDTPLPPTSRQRINVMADKSKKAKKTEREDSSQATIATVTAKVKSLKG